MRKIYNFILVLIFTPHLLLFILHKKKLCTEFEEYKKMWFEESKYSWYIVFVKLIASYHEYREVFYYRTGTIGSVLKRILPTRINLYINTKQEMCGYNLIIWHGFSTIINAKQIGNNCQIWQQVTIGKKTTSKYQDKPIIENNVLICAGSIVIGDILIGENSVIGAGSVITKDVPKNSVVVGNPARIIKLNGKKVDIIL
jgi:serine O-acetyltransferase